LGLAYAYTKLSTFQSVVLETKILSYEIKGGDSLEKIAATVGTTKQNLIDLNPNAAGTIFPKQKLSYQKAAIKATGFSVTAMRLQIYYNGGGDPNYAEKIDYCMDVIKKLTR
jgi:LysM repeat protein